MLVAVVVLSQAFIKDSRKVFVYPKSLQMVTAAMKLRHLLLGRKVMTNLDSLFKSRDITLPTKVPLVTAMVFPVVIMDVRVGL